MEIWKKSCISPEFIEISNMGRARSVERMTFGIRLGRENIQIRPGKILSPWVGKNGYLYLAVQEGKARKKYLIHRLIASAFCEGFKQKLSVNHINGKKLDNRPCNLEWITLNKNTELQWETGLVNLRGERHPLHKLSNDNVIEIKILLLSIHSKKDIAAKYGVSPSLIYKIENGSRCSET